MSFSLTGLFVWRNVCQFYVPLESFLSVEPMLDKALVCVDPTSDLETIKLCSALEKKFPEKVRVIYFEWPMGKLGNGQVIGTASNYALGHVRTSHFVNVQSDEIWSPDLMNWTRDNWQRKVVQGYECFEFKVLNLEHNMQQYQGGGDWHRQLGAGYTHAIKLGKACPAIRFAPDGWSLDGCSSMRTRVEESELSPIIHAHDNFRDSLIALRRTAADQFWPDVPHYGASADKIESTKDMWFNDPKWTSEFSPFSDLLPEFARALIGKTHYEVNYDLLREW